MKTLITILGPGASGKTTLGLKLGGANPEEKILSLERKVARPPKYTLFPNGVALVGNVYRGEDGIEEADLRSEIAKTLLTMKDVEYVIRNGVMVSKSWHVDWVSSLPLKFAALYVYFDISPEENERRLLQRRRNNGIVETKLPEKTYQNMLGFRGRAKGVFLAAQQYYTKEPVDFLILEETLSPEQCAKKVWKAVKKLCA